jgi:hypothetical protein
VFEFMGVSISVCVWVCVRVRVRCVGVVGVGDACGLQSQQRSYFLKESQDRLARREVSQHTPAHPHPLTAASKILFDMHLLSPVLALRRGLLSILTREKDSAAINLGILHPPIVADW